MMERKAPIALERALEILSRATPRPGAPEKVSLDRCLGRALAEEVRAPHDFPPFDRSMMDGFALHSRDAMQMRAKLRVVGESRAGHPMLRKVGHEEAASIMTGAPLPEGTDAVLPLEKAETSDPGWIESLEPVKPGQHVARRGEDQKAGDLLLAPGVRLRPQEVAVLAAAGQPTPLVFPLPRVAVLATGDELVSPETEPTFGRIRESNSYALEAQVARMGLPVRRFPVAPDEPEALFDAMNEAFVWSDCLLVSGGISVGAYDYVAAAFQRLGIGCHFHGVDIKPGKPVWFGTAGRRAVFGLPGNPVSSFVIFELFARLCLESMAGHATQARWHRTRFSGGPLRPMPRTRIVPARRIDGENGLQCEALAWSSSGDFFELARADALIKVPAKAVLEPGSLVEFLPI